MKKNKNQKKEKTARDAPILEGPQPTDKNKDSGGSSDAKPYPAPGDTV